MARFDSSYHANLVILVKHDEGGYAEINGFLAGSPFAAPSGIHTRGIE